MHFWQAKEGQRVLTTDGIPCVVGKRYGEESGNNWGIWLHAVDQDATNLKDMVVHDSSCVAPYSETLEHELKELWGSMEEARQVWEQRLREVEYHLLQANMKAAEVNNAYL